MADRERQGAELIHSFLALRKAVGWMAIALPIVLLAVHFGPRLTSISQSYYRDVNAIFVGMLCAIGVFLLFYRGYDGRDRAASFVAGICAIVVSQVPCGSRCRAPVGVFDALWQWQADYPKALVWLHFGAAALMFACLAYFCLALFPQTDKGLVPGHRKKRRNRLYIGCGMVIVAGLGLKAVDVFIARQDGAAWLPEAATFWIEAAMIWAFGWSWAVKGESISAMNDEEGKEPTEPGADATMAG